MKKGNCGIQSLKLNDLVVTDGIDKAEVLNSYFQSTCLYTHELDTELPDKGPNPYLQTLILQYKVLLNCLMV